MEARAIIAALRQGQQLDAASLRWFSQGLADHTVTDAQAGAFAMAVCWRGLDTQARKDLTLAMRDTGDVLAWDLDGPVLDKHSTGGVGDCVSLVLAPALAALGAYVPMISGRGLGHTGGTLDKLEAVPGLSTQVDEATLRDLLRTSGCAIVGASGRIAPADKRLYAIRDVTATVESLDLITASILSKKLAASPDALILDVKLGSGAFMKSQAEAQALARSLTETAQAAGCACSAMITDMNQPLAPNLGNALEMRSAMAVLSGQGGALLECAALLGGRLLVDCRLAEDEEAGQEKIRQVIADGTAMERFCRMLTQMGAPVGFEKTWQDILPRAPITRPVPAPDDGYVTAIEGEVLGHSVVRLGGGRLVESDTIDPSVGLADMCRLGQRVSAGDPLCVVHASDEAAAEQAVQTVLSAITLGEDAPELPPLLHERIG
ncbi:thymidine phosphorylase [Epibacterium sp. SM1979]|uniref:Thymidine phosphorylase n=1 Tax=Tritonibacter litoralis TaxID=2662264 RepID=A0A843YGI3_9RHOB|nr:thymidine phosphorylase [Tritonibacter litoralis]MQQ09961.1 thymidine phosphorylase [Tritonibacter litoralis]